MSAENNAGKTMAEIAAAAKRKEGSEPKEDVRVVQVFDGSSAAVAERERMQALAAEISRGPKYLNRKKTGRRSKRKP